MGNVLDARLGRCVQEVIHGAFLIVAYNEKVATTFNQELESKLLIAPNRSCIHKVYMHKVYMLYGFLRPGAEIQNDHLGYRRGTPNPQVAGVTIEDKMRYPGARLSSLEA